MISVSPSPSTELSKFVLPQVVFVSMSSLALPRQEKTLKMAEFLRPEEIKARPKEIPLTAINSCPVVW
jgi:hypothetical protein